MTTLATWLQGARQRVDHLDCELLVGHHLALSRAQILTHSDTPLSPQQQRELTHDLMQLAQGKPIAQLIGEREFWDLTFTITRDVLIPRPETELLVELALNQLPQQGRLLDLGTGSGAIAVTIAKHRPDAKVTATDISPDALAVAQLNQERHGTACAMILSDWFTRLVGHWDIIVANPPYIAADDPHLPQLRYEPQHALVSGTDGLDALRHIVHNARQHLTSDGLLMVEHGFDQGAAVNKLFHTAGYAQIVGHKDLAGHDRVTLGRCSTKTRSA